MVFALFLVKIQLIHFWQIDYVLFKSGNKSNEKTNFLHGKTYFFLIYFKTFILKRFVDFFFEIITKA
jgi:hypothetical protein